MCEVNDIRSVGDGIKWFCGWLIATVWYDQATSYANDHLDMELLPDALNSISVCAWCEGGGVVRIAMPRNEFVAFSRASPKKSKPWRRFIFADVVLNVCHAFSWCIQHLKVSAPVLILWAYKKTDVNWYGTIVCGWLPVKQPSIMSQSAVTVRKRIHW